MGMQRKGSGRGSGGGIDRRDFLGFGAGAAGLFCSLTAKDLPNLSERDVKQIDAAAASLKRPRSARRARTATTSTPLGWDVVDTYSAGDDEFSDADKRVFPIPEPAEGGSIREYWVEATPVLWDPLGPTRNELASNKKRKGVGFDTWMGMERQFRPFWGLAYQEMEPGFSGPKEYEDGSFSTPGMPGPLLEAEVGDVLEVHFRNADDRFNQPLTMHPHGVRYTPDYDGIYIGDFTRAGGFVAPGEEFVYRWECLPTSVGAWPYHDHGPSHVLNSARGLFGSIIIREKDAPKPDSEHFLHLHSFAPAVTRQTQLLHTINGRAFAGNTPTIRSKVGDQVDIHVFGSNNDFHTFHIHGHRWPDSGGMLVDSPTVGPSETLSARFREDNPGRWLYHCHVAAHMDAGMAGWFLVEA